MPITSTNPGGFVPIGYRKQRLTLSALAIGEVISGRFTAAGTPGPTLSYTIASTDITTATAGLEAAIESHVAANGSSAWAEVTVTNGTTWLDVVSLDADGQLLFESTPGAPSVVTKLWIGDAPAVAQVVSVVPLNVQIGDTFGLTINAKSIQVIATAATAANVVSLFVSAIAATTIPEWLEVTASASADGATLLLTANTPGVPFAVAAGSSDALRVDIRTMTAGVAGTNAQQQFLIPKSAAGTFAITFGDQTTSPIAVGATATAVRTALEALSNIGSGNCSVTSAATADGNDDLYIVHFTGTLAARIVAELIVDLTSTRPIIRTIQQGSTSGTVVQNEIQTIEIGAAGSVGETFTLTLDGQTTLAIGSPPLSTDDISSDIRNRISALSNVRDVTCVKHPTRQLYTVEWIDYEGSAPQVQLTASNYSASGSKTYRIAIANTPGVSGHNEVQRIAIEGTATGGTFTLTYAGQTTSGIAFNASTAAVTSALEALSNIGVGDVTVTGSPGTWLVEFTGTLAGGDRPLMTAASSLTGTTANNLTVATTTENSGPNDFNTAANWSPSGVPASGDDLRFELGASDCLYGLSQSGKTFPSVVIDMRWNARLGLPRLNENGYLEYRTRELTAGITSLVVGVGTGSGPQKVAINTGSVQTAIRVRDSGASSEINVPCVIWRGTNVANTITINGGEFGSAWYSDETCSLSRIDQTGGNVFLKNATIVDAVDIQAGTFRAYASTLGGKPLTV